VENDEKDIIRISLSDSEDAGLLFGIHDSNLKRIEEAFGAEIIMRRDELIVTGKLAAKAAGVIGDLLWILESGEAVDEQKLEYVIHLGGEGGSYRSTGADKDIIAFTHRSKPIKAKTLGQTTYINAIRTHDIVFGIGPAGTGKTYLAVAMAVAEFKARNVEKIILARPAVEAGERLGFLPGDLQEKVDPYLRPLYDALYEILGRDQTLRLKEKETIEVVPLAYMRGRTLDNAFIILDEAQNTTREQMKMFLTRMGFGAQVVVTGDVTQIDLPEGKLSGLLHAEKVLSGVDGISFIRLRESDVVRHTLVKKIIVAYEKFERRAQDRGKTKGDGPYV